MKRTPWFSVIKQPPVRHGWYEYRGPGMDMTRARWNGQFFETTDGANWWHLAEDDGDQWRGLAQPSERREG
jgi:hypothetical protein